jgi:hypothetical protein
MSWIDRGVAVEIIELICIEIRILSVSRHPVRDSGERRQKTIILKKQREKKTQTE